MAVKESGEYARKSEPAGFFINLVKNAILNSDRATLNQLSAIASEKAEIKIGNNLSLLIQNTPNFDAKLFEMPGTTIINILKYDAGLGQSGVGTIIRYQGAEILITAGHCVDPKFKMYTYTSEINPDIRELTMSKMESVEIGDLIIIFPKNQRAIELAKNTIEQMYLSAQSARNKPAAITTYKNFSKTELQQKRYFLPGQIVSFGLNAINQGQEQEFRIKANANYRITEGTSGSLVTNENGIPLGVLTGGYKDDGDKKDLFIPDDGTQNGIVSIISKEDRDILIQRLELISKSIGSSNSQNSETILLSGKKLDIGDYLKQ
jgi:hypothetical protein